jgi:hypothetical protein
VLALFFSRGLRQRPKHHGDDEQRAHGRPHRRVLSSRRHRASPGFRKTLPHHSGILAQQGVLWGFFDDPACSEKV